MDCEPRDLLTIFLFLILAVSNPALASARKLDSYYSKPTSTVQSPSVALQTGNAGSSSVTLSNSGSATVTGGLSFYENETAPTSALSLDPPGPGVSNHFTALSGSVTLSPAKTNDVIYVVVSIHNSGSQTVQSVTSSPSLTFVFRRSASSGTTARLETWYAKASAAGSYSITVTLSSSTDWVIIVFGINGANTASPFDPSVSAPPAQTGTGTPASTSVTTSFPNDLIIGSLAVTGNPGLTAGSGFTPIKSDHTSSNLEGSAEDEMVTAVQSSTSVSYSWSGATQVWVIIADAVIAGQSSASTDTSLSTPGTSGSFTLSSKSSAFLWSSPYTSGGTLYSGTWILDLWAASASLGSLTVSIFLVDSADRIVATVLSSGTTGLISTLKGEVKTTLSALSGGTIPANGQIMVMLTAISGGPMSFTIYWGASQLTNFQTPSTYDYILKAVNSAISSWTLKMSLDSSSSILRLSSLTVLFRDGGTSNQIVISNGAVTQSSGAAITLLGSSTEYIEVLASASSIGSSSLSILMRVTSGTSTSFSLYTISLSVN